MTARRHLGTCAAAAALAVSTLAPSVAVAEILNCEQYAESGRHGPQNVIVMVLDDVSASELPGLNPPLRWPQADAPLTASADFLDEARLRRPDLNRLAARVLAEKDGAGEIHLGQYPAPSDPPAYVVPSDMAGAAAADFEYSEATDADASHHILDGFGGLGTLTKKGVTFPRHYAPSGRCGPTRASIFSGRYHREVGVKDNQNHLNRDQVTIGDFLSSIKVDDERLYRTGMIGKWHLGNGEHKTASVRGYDDMFAYLGPSRAHHRTSSLHCSPPDAEYYCTSNMDVQQSGLCVTDAQCNNAPGCTPGTCACAQGDKASTVINNNPKWLNAMAGHCYPKAPPACDPALEEDEDPLNDVCATGETCERWGSYVGPQPRTERVGCHPLDIGNPMCCRPKKRGKSKAEGGHYPFDFNKRRNPESAPPFTRKTYWEFDSGTNADAWPCNDNSVPTMHDGSGVGGSGLIGKGGCRYDTRYFRDAAKNFILRNKEQPFYLHISLHGLHAKNLAPKRVEAHYKDTAPGRPAAPNEAVGFWGALEEIDAAIGQIVSLVNGFCDATSHSYVDLGKACTQNGDCADNGEGGPGGECNDGLAKKTMFLLTSDHGRASAGYGEPMLRGGKGSVDEGGIRVGLQAWSGVDPATGVGELEIGRGAAEEEDFREELGNAVGGHVDLLATVAHAAGCKPNPDGRYRTRTCSTDQQQMCETDGECPDSGTCNVNKRLAGRTLLPVLSGKVRDYPESDAMRRDFAFAEYAGSGKAIMSRVGGLEDAVRVCGARNSELANEADEEAVPPVPARIARERKAGSASLCRVDADCAAECIDGQCQGASSPKACNQSQDCTETCWSNGKFCVPEEGLGPCRNPDNAGSGCEWSAYTRCQDATQCPQSGDVCENVYVPCNQCPKAAWKLVGTKGENGSAIEPKQLHDLSTNPEEEDLGGGADRKQNFLNLVRLTGGTHPALTPAETTAPVDTIYEIQQELVARLQRWYHCVLDNSGGQEDCESLQPSP